jgi:hypothetical protein
MYYGCEWLSGTALSPYTSWKRTHTHRSPQERVQATKPTRNVKTRLKYIELINRMTFKYAGHRTAVLVR